jgi:hypothetical protein
MLAAAVLGLSVVVLVAFGTLGRGQNAGAGGEAALRLAACAAAQPVAGGKVYLYVVDQLKHVVTVMEDGTLAASYKLPNPRNGSRYTLVAGRAEPVDGGQAYAFVVDQFEGVVHVFRGTEHVGSEGLPETGQKM